MGDTAGSASLSHRPAAALRPYVRRITGYRMPVVDLVHHGLPSPELTFLIALDGPLTVGWTPDLAAAQPFWSMVSGMHSAPAYVFPSSGRVGIQLDLTPAGARALLGLPAGALSATTVDLAEIAGRVGADLAEQVRAAPDWPGRFARLEESLLAMVEPEREIRAELGWAWRRLVAGGDRRVDRLADEIGWSRGYFARLFAGEFGLRPKETARVVRFDRARRALAAATVDGAAGAGGPSIADIAAEHGYADQAHLSREWRQLADCTPGEWQQEMLAFVQS